MDSTELNKKLFNQTTLERLLRKNSIEKISNWTKYLIYCSWFILIVMSVRFLVSEWLKEQAAVDQMQNYAKMKIAEINETTEGTKQKIDYERIIKHSIFGNLSSVSTSTSVNPNPKPTPTSTTAGEEKKLDETVYELHGVFLWGDSEPAAIIVDTKKKEEEEVYLLNDILNEESGTRLVAIKQDRVEIERNGTRETLLLDQSSAGNTSAQPAENVIVVNEKDIDDALANLPLLLQQARAVPFFKEGKSVGLRLFAIRPGSLYEKIGLQNGDILKEINGTSMSDITQAMKLFERLKQEKNISLKLERQREEKVFQYSIR